MNEKELLLELKSAIEKIKFNELFHNYLIEYFKENKIYKHIHEVQEFISLSGRVCEDYSGKIEPFLNKEELINYIQEEEWFSEYTRDGILENLYNGQQMASYCSGSGWIFPTIKDDLEEYFNELKYETYEKFINQNKEIILKVHNLKYASEEEFKDNIYDDLDNTNISDYIVFDSYDIFQKYLDSIKNEFIINIIKEVC